jgi:hypothetical protein
MSFNPYAAPVGPAAQQQAPAPQGNGPQAWDATDAVGTGWNVVKQHAAVLIGSLVVYAIITAIVNWTIGIAFGVQMMNSFDFSNPEKFQKNMEQFQQRAPLYSVAVLIGQGVIGSFFTAGFIKMYLAAVRGQSPDFGDLFSGGRHFVPMLGLWFLSYFVKILPPVRDFGGAILGQNVATLAMFVAFVPFVFIALALTQAQYFVVDQNLGPVEAMKASFKVTQGQKGQIFLFWVLAVLLYIGGFLACCFGLLLTVPIVDAGAAIIYTRLTGTTGTPEAFAGYGPPGMPGGGWGPPPGGGYGGPPPGGGYGGPPPGGYGGPPPGGYGGPPPGGGYGGPPPGGNPYGGPPPGGNPYGGGGYGPPPGGNPYG